MPVLRPRSRCVEYLETKGVPVLGYGTDELPAFYTRESGLGVDARIDTPEDLWSRRPRRARR